MSSNIDREKLCEEVFLFLQSVTGIELKDFNLSSSLELDLGITGDDAEELIFALADRFKVDISEFSHSSFFYPEPSILSFRSESKKRDLTVNDLVEAVETKMLK